MTHDPDANMTMPQGTEGDGFVMWFDGLPVVPTVPPQPEPPRCIEDDVRELEKLISFE